MTKKVVSLRFPIDLWEFIKIDSIKNGVTMNKLLIRLLRKYQKQALNKEELLKRTMPK